MSVVDVHTHVTPRRFVRAIEREGVWHTLGPEVGELHIPKFSAAPAELVADMDSLEVDVYVLTPNEDFFKYDLDPQLTATIARECNEELREYTQEYPQRFCALATLPMQDVSRAISEMEHAMMALGFKGVTLGDHVNGHTWDEPQFRPFWKAAEELDAFVFFHQCTSTVVTHLTRRYGLANTVGNLTDRALTFGALVFGGVIDEFPDLKLCLAHAGGYVAFGIARMDRGWQAGATLERVSELGDARFCLQRPPSEYLGRFYYDCCTHSEASLRFLIDMVGADRVVLGTDWPAPMILDDAVPWIRGLESLAAGEKEAILSTNATRALGL
jgi:aminocarboxymuconate-semialdehyde decarboxylase